MIKILFPKMPDSEDIGISIWGLLALLALGPIIYLGGVWFFDFFGFMFDRLVGLYTALLRLRDIGQVVSLERTWIDLPPTKSLANLIAIVSFIYFSLSKIIFGLIFTFIVSLVTIFHGYPTYVRLVAALLAISAVISLLLICCTFASTNLLVLIAVWIVAMIGLKAGLI